jgi:hypothetical protein
MYLSIASRTTQASDTFFSLAIASRLLYISGGKLIEARTAARWDTGIFFALTGLAITTHIRSPRYTTSVT